MKETPLSLEHQTLLTPLFKAMDQDISEYSFANLYLFREVHGYRLIEGEDLYIGGKTRDGLRLVIPTKTPDKLSQSLLKTLLGSHDILFPIPEEWLSHFDPSLYQWQALGSDSDYVYTTNKMAHYPGRRLSGRRNLVHQFLEHYPEHHVYPLNSSNKADAVKIAKAWKEGLAAGVLHDLEECLEAIDLAEKLGLSGRILYDDGTPIAFEMGEELGKGVYVIHFAKALVKYKGVYQFLYQDTAQAMAPEIAYLNLEQDLGDPSLKHAKEAYLPDRKVLKYRVKLAAKG